MKAPSKKSSIMTNRKSPTSFPIRYFGYLLGQSAEEIVRPCVGRPMQTLCHEVSSVVHPVCSGDREQAVADWVLKPARASFSWVSPLRLWTRMLLLIRVPDIDISEGNYCCIFLPDSYPILLHHTAAAHQMYSTGFGVGYTQSSHSPFFPPSPNFFTGGQKVWNLASIFDITLLWAAIVWKRSNA